LHIAIKKFGEMQVVDGMRNKCITLDQWKAEFRKKVIHRLDHEVSAVIEVDGVRNDLRKCLQENWVKPRGQAEEVLSGNVTSYYWNDVPLKKGEYEAKIASLVSEELFKAITNPAYFNNTLKWEQRRKALISMAGTISNATILDSITTPDNKHRMDALLDVLTSGKTAEDYRKELVNKKNRIKQELETLPARIDEAERSKPEPIDEAALQAQLATIREQIAAIVGNKVHLFLVRVQSLYNHTQQGIGNTFFAATFKYWLLVAVQCFK